MIVSIVIVISIVLVFLAGCVYGYGARVREELDAYRDERIRSALKHWHGHTSHRGCTIFSPEVKEGGIR